MSKKPHITRTKQGRLSEPFRQKWWWECRGDHPRYGLMNFGFGRTPREAYEQWLSDPIPF